MYINSTSLFALELPKLEKQLLWKNNVRGRRSEMGGSHLNPVSLMRVQDSVNIFKQQNDSLVSVQMKKNIFLI